MQKMVAKMAYAFDLADRMSILAILLLRVKYTPTYPDELPDLELEIIESGTEEDHLSQDEQETLLQRLREVVSLL